MVKDENCECQHAESIVGSAPDSVGYIPGQGSQGYQLDALAARAHKNKDTDKTSQDTCFVTLMQFSVVIIYIRT